MLRRTSVSNDGVFDRRPARSWIARFWANVFVVFIVLPTTAPFQALTFNDLFNESVQGARTSADAPFLAVSNDTAVCSVPQLDGTEGRLKVAAQRPADASSARDITLAAPDALRGSEQRTVVNPQRPPAVLRV